MHPKTYWRDYDPTKTLSSYHCLIVSRSNENSFAFEIPIILCTHQTRDGLSNVACGFSAPCVVHVIDLLVCNQTCVVTELFILYDETGRELMTVGFGRTASVRCRRYYRVRLKQKKRIRTLRRLRVSYHNTRVAVRLFSHVLRRTRATCADSNRAQRNDNSYDGVWVSLHPPSALRRRRRLRARRWLSTVVTTRPAYTMWVWK